jgi:adenine phosphoribosyltransferase
MQDPIAELRDIIRDVPDFPKKGIIFKDITTLLNRGDLFRKAIDQVVEHYKGKGIQKVVAVESRGFIFGAPVAYHLGAGVVPVRTKGKLPYKTVSASYQLEYGVDTLEMHADALKPGEKVLIIDDLLATGATATATAELVKKLGADIAGIAFVIELSFLEGRKSLKDYDVFTLIKY